MNHPTHSHRRLANLIEESLQNFYQIQLGHQPRQIACQLFHTTLAVIVKGSVTQPEKLLMRHGQQDLAQRVRSSLEQLMRSQFKLIIEDLSCVSVGDLMIDTHLHTDQTSIIAIFEQPPVLNHNSVLLYSSDHPSSSPCSPHEWAVSEDDDE